jgi:hypothetical protein
MPSRSVDLCCVKDLIAREIARIKDCCTFVWRQSDPDPRDNVYANWGALYSALQQAPEGFKLIAVDNSLATATVPPGGPYDVSGTIWQALPSRLSDVPGPAPYVLVEIEEGARLDDIYAIGELVTMRGLTTNAALPNLFWGGNNRVVVLQRGAAIEAPNGVPVATVSAPFTAIALDIGAGLFSPTDQPVITQSPGTFLVIDAYTDTAITADPVANAGGGDPLLVRYSASAQVPTDAATQYPSHAGFVILQPLDWAIRVFYDDYLVQPPAELPPTLFMFVQQFLDRIKSTAVVEQQDVYHAPAMPVSGGSAMLALSQNPMQGAVYLTQKRQIVQNLFVYGSSPAGDSCRVGIYQRRGGNLGPLPSEPNMLLLADVTFALPLADAVVSVPLPSFNLEAGYYCLVWGLASGAGGQLLAHTCGSIDLLNVNQPPGKALLVFDVTMNASAPLNPTFDPVAPGAVANLATRPLVARGGLFPRLCYVRPHGDREVFAPAPVGPDPDAAHLRPPGAEALRLVVAADKRADVRTRLLPADVPPHGVAAVDLDVGRHGVDVEENPARLLPRRARLLRCRGGARRPVALGLPGRVEHPEHDAAGEAAAEQVEAGHGRVHLEAPVGQLELRALLVQIAGEDLVRHPHAPELAVPAGVQDDVPPGLPRDDRVAHQDVPDLHRPAVLVHRLQHPLGHADEERSPGGVVEQLGDVGRGRGGHEGRGQLVADFYRGKSVPPPLHRPLHRGLAERRLEVPRGLDQLGRRIVDERHGLVIELGVVVAVHVALEDPGRRRAGGQHLVFFFGPGRHQHSPRAHLRSFSWSPRNLFLSHGPLMPPHEPVPVYWWIT